MVFRICRCYGGNGGFIENVYVDVAAMESGASNDIDLDNLGSNLSDEEAQKLKALLKEHSNDNLSDKK